MNVQSGILKDEFFIHAEDQLDYTLNLMCQRNIGRLPVVEDKDKRKMVGIVTSSDIVATYMESQNSLKTAQKDASESIK